MLWSTRSKAFRKSTKTVRTDPCESRAVIHVWRMAMRACVVDLDFPQPNWEQSRCGSMKERNHFPTIDSNTLAMVGIWWYGPKIIVNGYRWMYLWNWDYFRRFPNRTCSICFDFVEKNRSTCSIRQCWFDSVVGVDGASCWLLAYYIIIRLTAGVWPNSE